MEGFNGLKNYFKALGLNFNIELLFNEIFHSEKP